MADAGATARVRIKRTISRRAAAPCLGSIGGVTTNI